MNSLWNTGSHCVGVYVCYKTDKPITSESSKVFGAQMVREKHNSVLEMRVVTYEVFNVHEQGLIDELEHLFKHVIIDRIGGSTYLITASIRAYREMYMLAPANHVVRKLVHAVALAHSVYFEDFDIQAVSCDDTMIHVEKVALDTLDSFMQLNNHQLWRRHRFIAVKLIVNRAVTHEIVRHRPCSFLQESQRYCCYDSDRFGNQVTFIKPLFFAEGSEEYRLWLQAIEDTAQLYLTLLKTVSPQAARTVLPNSCKTEIIIFANVAQWNHILHMRTSKATEPSMREVMVPLRAQLQKMFPSDAFDVRYPEGHVDERTS